MKNLNRNNADIEKLRDKKVAVRLVGKETEIDFREWLEENGIHFNNKEVLLIRNGIRTEVCYCIERNSWDWCDEKWFVEKGYSLYEWEIVEGGIKMKKLNRNNADIKKILNKKVAIVCDSKEKELDFRKWTKQYVNAVDEDYVYTNCGNGICICLDYDGLKWDWTKYFLENNYSIYEWEVAEEKTYTIKDVVENEGKVYKCITDCNNGILYKYIDDVLYATPKYRIEWKKSLVGLRKLLKYEFIEYKPEPEEIITFEEALKEMETKVCRCLFSNRCITTYDSHFVDCINGEYTNLSMSEITGDWVVIE